MTTISEKKCAFCDNSFKPSTPKHKFCSDNCKVKSHQKVNKAKIELQSHELEELKSQPATKQLINPDWDILSRKIGDLKYKKDKIVDQKKLVENQIDNLTNGAFESSFGAVIGAFAGFGIILLPTTNEDGLKIKASGSVLSFRAIIFILFVFAGFMLGKTIGTSTIEKDKNKGEKLIKLQSEVNLFLEQIKTLNKEIELLEIEIKEIPKVLEEIENKS